MYLLSALRVFAELLLIFVTSEAKPIGYIPPSNFRTILKWFSISRLFHSARGMGVSTWLNFHKKSFPHPHIYKKDTREHESKTNRTWSEPNFMLYGVHTLTRLQCTTETEAISLTFDLWLMTVLRLREATVSGGMPDGPFPGGATIKSLGSSTFTSVLHQLIWRNHSAHNSSR